ncbi:conserved hypothetical protein [Hyella patelloides LEGE 07179]|uniref:PatA-like N-terminal domain-containing protein n=1 Tax=Hyella patelloides LEGE 07179 TaxID=945734 RepID=A0A563W0P1_9CYAN|nr:DUF4388 domain-containing protein [Hyella patelloides]VEP17259.1 conserved hypothetical protein [Hyella patelloides LEGE 07179]
MGISGSLQDFSLPEILQIIDNGSKSGRLSITSSLKGKALQNQGTNDLWFKNGNFVALSNPFKYNNLLSLIKKENIISSKNIVKLYSLEREISIPLGEYCLQQSLLSVERVNQLLENQLKEVYSLFELDDGWFFFDDADSNNQVSEPKESFPLMEMTGKKCDTLTISLQGMRSLSKLDNRLTEQMPEPNSGLIKLEDNLNCKLLPIEACLWDDANGKMSLKKIAQKTLFEIQDLQTTALRLILIGLLEEVPVSREEPQTYAAPSLERKLALSSTNSMVKTKSQGKVSNSLLGNLVDFLRNNF